MNKTFVATALTVAAVGLAGPSAAHATASRILDHRQMRDFHPAYGKTPDTPAAAVPELDPAGMGSALLLLGAAGAACVGRRRRDGSAA